MTTSRRAAIVAPVRTPVGTFGGSLRAVPVEELAATAIKAVLERTGIDPEIIAFVKSKIASYKAPRTVWFVDDLPRSEAGKLMKSELKARYWAAAAD